MHPLWPIIRAVNLETGPGPLDYEPLPLPSESANRHAYGSEMVLNVSMMAVSLLTFLEGDIFGRIEEFDIEKHQELFRFVSSTPIGNALGVLSDEARRSVRFIPAFSVSSRQPGFIKAVSTWTEINGAPNGGRWRETLARNWFGDGDHPQSDDYWFEMCLKDSGDSIEFARELYSIMRRREAATRKKSARGLPARHSRFKARILQFWIISSLWCRTPSGILSILEPDQFHDAQDVDRIIADMSRLGLTSTRFPEAEPLIEKAELDFRQKLDSVHLP